MSEVERAEAQLWDAVRGLYVSAGRSKTEAAATAVEALAAYRTAVEAQAVAAYLDRSIGTRVRRMPVNA